MHIYSHQDLLIALLEVPTTIIAITMMFNKRAVEQSGGWFRWAYMAWAGFSVSVGVRNLNTAMLPLNTKFDVDGYLYMVSLACLVVMLVMAVLGNYHKRREAKLRLLPVAETPVVDSWPPAPRAE